MADRTPSPVFLPPPTTDIESWREDAACSETDPTLFFSGDDASNRAAMQLCAGCPVRDRCLETALTLGEMHGIWGGTTEGQRRRMIRARRREVRESRRAA